VRGDRSGADQPDPGPGGRRPAADGRAPGGRAEAVLRAELQLGPVVPRGARRAAGVRGRVGAGASAGSGRDRLALVTRGGAAVDAAVPDHRVVGGNGALGSGRRPVAAVGLAPARAGGAAGAGAAGDLGVGATAPAGGGARRLAPDGRAGRDLLRACPGDPAAGDLAEPGGGGARVCRALLILAGE